MSYENQLRISISNYLKENGIKQIWLAEQLGVDRVILNKKLNGKKPLRLEDVQAIESVVKHKFISIK
jgi:predicted XRE-type DNA-binding protein